MVGGGIWAFTRMCSAMTQLIMCAVRTLRRAQAVVGEDVACVQGEQRRRVGGNDSLSESSSMMARVVALDGALIGELVQPLLLAAWIYVSDHFGILGYSFVSSSDMWVFNSRDPPTPTLSVLHWGGQQVHPPPSCLG